MSSITVRAGELVRSLAGRDKGRYFVAVSVHGGRVMIADGRKRKLSSPNLMSLASTIAQLMVTSWRGLSIAFLPPS